MSTDTAISNNGLASSLSTPTHSSQLPAPCSKACLNLCNTHLARPNPDLCCVSTSIFKLSNSLWRSDISSYDKGIRQLSLNVLNHFDHTISMAMSNVNRDKLRCVQIGRAHV